MNTNKNAGKLAIGLIFVLSVVVFGSILYVGFTAVNTEFAIMDNGGDDGFDSTLYRDHAFLLADDHKESILRGYIEYVPCELSETVEANMFRHKAFGIVQVSPVLLDPNSK